jgi:Ca2+-binding EF-hand superfamily protein
MLVAACALIGNAEEKTEGIAGKVEKATSKIPDFKKMDTNGDGKISEAEYAAYIVEYPDLGLSEAGFATWDVDKDGMVTLKEFEAIYPTESGMGGLKSLLEKVKKE